jgi:hypothetical protein
MPKRHCVELWYHGGHGSLKNSGEQYWYKGKNNTQ